VPAPAPVTETPTPPPAAETPALAPETPASPPVAETPAPPPGRPAPRYGEYAPEGWVSPVEIERQRREREAAARRREQAAMEAARAQAGRTAPPGRQRGASKPSAAETGWAQTPRRSDGEPQAPGHSGPDASGLERLRFGASPVDVLLTVVLLAFGLTTVLQQVVGVGRVAGQIAQQITIHYTALAHPEALVPATALNAVVGAVLFAGALWWSLVRLRRRKIAFWVPLVAGALFGAFSTIVYVVVLMHDPALAAYVTTNGGA